MFNKKNYPIRLLSDRVYKLSQKTSYSDVRARQDQSRRSLFSRI